MLNVIVQPNPVLLSISKLCALMQWWTSANSEIHEAFEAATSATSKCHSVDGRNPAPFDMDNIPFFIGFYTFQVVQEFFHQPLQGSCKIFGFLLNPTFFVVLRRHRDDGMLTLNSSQVGFRMLKKATYPTWPNREEKKSHINQMEMFCYSQNKGPPMWFRLTYFFSWRGVFLHVTFISSRDFVYFCTRLWMWFDQQFLRDIVLFLASVMLHDHGISGHVFLISGHVFLISGHVGPPPKIRDLHYDFDWNFRRPKKILPMTFGVAKNHLMWVLKNSFGGFRK